MWLLGETGMEQIVRQTAQVADIVEPSVPGVSWAAVVAGAVASLALTLVLLSFGVGMGFSSFRRGAFPAFPQRRSRSELGYTSS
jgi:hypothetical protein